jgi:hypothetical protein
LFFKYLLRVKGREYHGKIPPALKYIAASYPVKNVHGGLIEYYSPQLLEIVLTRIDPFKVADVNSNRIRPARGDL